VVLCICLALITVALYEPVVHNGYTNFDDIYYILKNPQVQAGLTLDTVKWAFTKFYVSNWHPLTWLSHAVDCQIFKLDPGGPHLESALWHAGNAVLLLLLLESATGLIWPSLMVAALFALHPVNVESVAWAAERKNVLSLFFCLLTMHAYGWYVRRTNWKRYVIVAALFALGLMAKPQIITLPFLLLLWDYWPLRRMRLSSPSKEAAAGAQQMSFAALFREKVPLLLLSSASGVITVFAQASGDAMPNLEARWKIGNAMVAYARYLGLAFWPTNLSVLYPHPARMLAAWKVMVSAGLLLAITAAVLRANNQRYLAVGWFWFLGTLVPVIGVFQVGVQAMADRYAYLSFIGLFVAVVWRIADWGREKRVSAIWLSIPAVAVLAVLGGMTRHEVGYWRSSETLWRHTLSVTDGNYMAHDNLARDLVAQNRPQEAIVEFKAADALNWYTPQEMLQVGLYEQAHGDLPDAVDEYGRILNRVQDHPSRALLLSFMGSAFMQAGDFTQASQSYAEALRENPESGAALIGSGLLAERSGNRELAVSQISHATKVESSDVSYLLLAQALRRAGRKVEADAAVEHAQQISRDVALAQRTAAQMLSAAAVAQ
jgi:protein O-mannosyl-transferase